MTAGRGAIHLSNPLPSPHRPSPEPAFEQTAAVDQNINGTGTVEDSAGRRGDRSSNDRGGKIQQYNRAYPNHTVHAVPMGQLRRR